MSDKLTEKDIAALRTLVPLHTLSAEHFDELLGKVRLQASNRGTIIFREGDADHEHIYLLEGNLALMSGNKAVDKIAAGSDTARFPIAHQLPRRYGARAATAVRLAHIDSRFVSDLLARNQSVDYQVNELEEDGQHGDWMAQLLQSRIMQQIPPANIQGVMMRVQQVEVDAGDVVIKEGDEGDAYFMLSQGRALVTRDLGNGDPPVELAQIGPGASFGEEALLSDSPRNSTITMLSKGLLLRLNKDDFIELIQRPLSRRYGFDEAQRQVTERGAVWLDVRSQQDYENGSLPGSINLPFEALRYQAASLGRDRQYIVCSERGDRAIAAAFLLTEQGYDVAVLSGGYEAIHAAGEDSAAETSPAEAGAADAAERERLLSQVEAAEQRAREMEARLQALAKEKEAADEQRQSQFQALKESIDNAKAKILRSEDERKELRDLVSQTKHKDKEWQQRMDGLERELIAERERAESASDSLQEIAQKLTVVMEERELERAKHDQVAGELKEQLTVVQLELEEATQELADLRDAAAKAADLPDPQALAEAEAAAEEAKQQAAQLREQCQALEAAAAEQAAQQQEQAAKLEAQKQALADAAAEQLALTEARDQAFARATAAEAALSEQQGAQGETEAALQQQVQELQQAAADQQAAQQAEISALQQQLEAAQQASAAQQDELSAARDAALARAEAAEQALSEQQAAQQTDVTALQQQLEREQQATGARIAELEGQLAAASEAQESLRKEQQLAQDQLQAAEQALADLQANESSQAASLQQQLEEQQLASQARISELDGELERAWAKHAEITVERDQSLQQVQELTTSLGQLEENLDQARGSRDEQLQSLQMEHDRALAETKVAQEQAAAAAQRGDELRDNLHQAQAQLQVMTDEQTALKEQFAAATGDQQQLRSELERAQAALAESQATLAEAVAAQQAQGEEQVALQRQLDELQAGTTERQAQDQKALAEREQAIAELTAKVSELEEALKQAHSMEGDAAQHQEALSDAQKTIAARVDEIARLQKSLDAASAARDEAEQKLAQFYAEAGSVSAELAERDSLIEELQAEVDKLQAQQQAATEAEQARAGLQAELDSAQTALQQAELANETLCAENARLEAAAQTPAVDSEDLARLQAELDAAQAQLTALQQENSQIEQARQSAEAAREQAVVDAQKIRAVMEEYVEQIQAAQEEGGSDEVASLRMELALVRQQAQEELSRLQQGVRGDDPLDREALRQEVATIKQNLLERQREIEEANEQRLMIEESLEDANRQIDELRRAMDQARVEAEEAVFQREEAEQARRQVEQTLHKYQEEAVEADALDLRDERLKPTRGALHMGGVLGGLSFGSLLLGVLAGSGVLIGGLELALWVMKKGELFTLLFGGQ